MKENDIYASCSTPIASSGPLLNTSNSVFSEWGVRTYFTIENGVPIAEFRVVEKWFSNSTCLFKTNNYKELERWIENHHEEIKKQVNAAASKWIEKYKKYL